MAVTLLVALGLAILLKTRDGGSSSNSPEKLPLLVTVGQAGPNASHKAVSAPLAVRNSASKTDFRPTQPTQAPGYLSPGADLIHPRQYGETRTVAVVDNYQPANHALERVRLVGSTQKYPLLRVEERFLTDADAGTEPVLIERTVMVADHVLVRPQPLVSEAEFLRSLRTAGFAVIPPKHGRPDVWKVTIPSATPGDLPRALAALQKLDSKVSFAEPDYLVSTQDVQANDPMASQLWALKNTGQTGGRAGADISAPGAWDVTTGSSQVVVAVIDTGVDYLHPDLAGNIYQRPGETVDGKDSDSNGYIDDVRGWNFYADNNDPMDDQFHGTHVAGTIGAAGNNAVGVTGVAWQVRLVPIKFLSASGSGYTSDAVDAVRYAADIGARVANNSWGGGGYSLSLKAAIDYARTKGCLFVAASGNSGQNNDLKPTYPASYVSANIISVGATDHNDQIAGFSNFGRVSVDLFAPGVGILSTFPRTQTAAMASSGLSPNYGRISGTSMATPHVSGVAALVLAARPTLTVDNLRAQLLARCDFLPQLAGYATSGGRLNAARAVDPSWNPSPASPLVDTVEWDDSGANNNGTAEPGEWLSVYTDLLNSGGTTASNLGVELQVVSGPAVVRAPALITLAQLEAYQKWQNPNPWGVQVGSGAQDGDKIVLRIRLTWTGNGSLAYDFTIPVVKLPARTVVEVPFSVGEILADPARNRVYAVSPSDWRVFAVDTDSATVAARATLDQTQLEATTKVTGGLAITPDGSQIYVALTGTRRIEALSLPDLVHLNTLSLDFEPYSLAIDKTGRLFATSTDYWGPLRQIDPVDGHTLAKFDKSTTGGRFYKGALLRMDATRERLFLGETGLRVEGGPGYIYEWNVAGATPIRATDHPMNTVFLNDFVVDTAHNQILTMHGGIYGVQVTSLIDETYGNVWPLNSPYGVAIAKIPGRAEVYAGSGSSSTGVMRRFGVPEGQPLGSYSVQPTGSTLLPRGLAVTPNNRLLSVTSVFTGSASQGIAGTRYYLGLTGVGSINLQMPPRDLIAAKLVVAKVDFNDLGGNGDGLANPGESVNLAPVLANLGEADSAPQTVRLDSLGVLATVAAPATRPLSAISGGKQQRTLPDFTVNISPAATNGSTLDFNIVLVAPNGTETTYAHRLDVKTPVSGPGLGSQVSSSLQYSGLAAHPLLNEVYLVDKRNLRVLAFDTQYGMVRAIAPIPVDPRLVNGTLVQLGEPAVSPDGSYLAVAAKDSSKVHIFTLPGLEWVASHSPGFKPVSVAFDASNRLYAVGSGTGQAVQMDTLTGSVLATFGPSPGNTLFLRAEAGGRVLALASFARIDFYSTTGAGAPVLLSSYTSASNAQDIDIDYAAGRVYAILGDNNLTRLQLDNGQSLGTWPLNQSWGSAVRLAPGGTVMGVSDYWYGGGIRRFQRSDGSILQDVVTSTNANGIMPRGLAVTPNGRAVYITKKWNGSSGNGSVDGYNYEVGLIGATVDLAEPSADPFQLVGLTCSDPAPANNNGYPDPGETIQLQPTLKNVSMMRRTNVRVRLVSSRDDVVPTQPDERTFSAIGAGVQFSMPTVFPSVLGASIPDGTALGLALRVDYDGGSQTIPLPLSSFKKLLAQVQVNFAIGAQLSDPTRNLCYIIDRTNFRVLAIDTDLGAVTAAVRLAGDPGNGEMALSADGSKIFVALKSASSIQILTAETLEPVDVIHVNFNPFSVAQGSNGYIYATTTEGWGLIRQINPADGSVTSFGKRNYYSGGLLRTSGNHSRLYICELGLSASSGLVDEYAIDSETTPTHTGQYPYYPSNLQDFRLDEDKRRIYLSAGGTYGVQITEMDTGLSAIVWPFNAPYGSAVDYLPGSNYVYGGSGGSYDGRIRRFDRATGRPLADFPVTGTGYNASLMTRALAVTANDRLLYCSSYWTGSSSQGLNGTRYFVNLAGHGSLNMTVPSERPRLDAGTNQTIKMSSPLLLQSTVDFPGQSGQTFVTWSVVDGPGAAVFSMSGAAGEVNFSEPGKYRIRMRAINGTLSGSDYINVEVLPGDAKVSVTALAPVLAKHPTASGGFLVSRDGDLSQALTIPWTIGGTATAGSDYNPLASTIVLPAGESSTTIPLIPKINGATGTVQVSLQSGTGYSLGASGQASVSIENPTLNAWLDGLQEIHPEQDLSRDADPDGDGQSNLREYFFCSSPLAAGSRPSFSTHAVRDAQNHARLQISYRALKNAAGVTVTPMFSVNLVDWSPLVSGQAAIEELERVDNGDGTETVTLQTSSAAAAYSRGFLDIKIEPQP